MSADRPGFALVLSMLLVLALAVLGMGLLATGTGERVIAGAAVRRAQAERRAEAAVLEALRSWSTRAMVGMAPGQRRSLTTDRPGTTAAAERIDSTLFLLSGTAVIPDPGGAARATAGLLVRVLHPDRLARSFPGAVASTGSLRVEAGLVDGRDPCGVPGPGTVAPIVSIDPSAVVEGAPPTLRSAPETVPLPDPFAPALAASIATVLEPGPVVTPGPSAVAGRCVPDRRNWGTLDPAHPCYGLLPVVLATDLTVDGGVGFGVLIVDGDLRVRGGAVLAGVIAVRGRLEIEAGSVIRGAARADSVVTSGTILRDGCAVSAALSSPAFDQPFRPPERWWVPQY